jgi:hypothetical protein
LHGSGSRGRRSRPRGRDRFPQHILLMSAYSAARDPACSEWKRNDPIAGCPLAINVTLYGTCDCRVKLDRHVEAAPGGSGVLRIRCQRSSADFFSRNRGRGQGRGALDSLDDAFAIGLGSASAPNLSSRETPRETRLAIWVVVRDPNMRPAASHLRHLLTEICQHGGKSGRQGTALPCGRPTNMSNDRFGRMDCRSRDAHRCSPPHRSGRAVLPHPLHARPRRGDCLDYADATSATTDEPPHLGRHLLPDRSSARDSSAHGRARPSAEECERWGWVRATAF